MFFYCMSVQLEKAKKKEAAFIVTIAKREQEISDLKVLLYFFQMLNFFFTFLYNENVI